MSQTGRVNSGTDIPGCMCRLSNGERLWLWSPPANVALAARIIGDVSENDLMMAINAVRRMHPLLGAKAIFDDHPDFYTRPFYNNTFEVGEISSHENLERQSMAISLWPGTYDRLERIKAPTLIVAGMEDLLLPSENSLILANGINGSWLVRLDNAGHGLFGQYPNELARIVADFIELSAADPFTQSLNSSFGTSPGEMI